MKKRIGIDIRLQNETGIGRYIRNLIHYLPQLDTKNEYVFLNPNVSWHSFKEQTEMPKVFKKNNLDLVHIPYFNVPYTYSDNFIVTIHDLIINEFDTGRASTHNIFTYKFKRIGYKIIVNHAVHKSKAIIVPSHATKNDLIRHYPNVEVKKIQVIYNGLDRSLKPSKQIKNSQINKLDSNKYFLYVGNAYPHKNIETLLTAFSQLTDTSTYLVLVGEMNYFYHQVLDKVKELHLTNRVILTGSVSDSELLWLYRHAQACVLPSFMEGFGLPALEAMHSNCLVVTSSIEAFKEVCSDGAIYFDPKNANDLQSKLQIALDPKQKRTIDQIKKKASTLSSKYSWKKTAKETAKVYERCLSI